MNLEQKRRFFSCCILLKIFSPKLVENHDVETSKTGRLSTEGQGGKGLQLAPRDWRNLKNKGNEKEGWVRRLPC